jgi:hypothetical protein
MADTSRDYFRGGNPMVDNQNVMNGNNANQPQWGTIKQGTQVAAGTYTRDRFVET